MLFVIELAIVAGKWITWCVAIAFTVYAAIKDFAIDPSTEPKRWDHGRVFHVDTRRISFDMPFEPTYADVPLVQSVQHNHAINGFCIDGSTNFCFHMFLLRMCLAKPITTQMGMDIYAIVLVSELDLVSHLVEANLLRSADVVRIIACFAGAESIWRHLSVEEHAWFSNVPKLRGGLFSSDGTDGSFRGNVYDELALRITGRSLYRRFRMPRIVKKMAECLSGEAASIREINRVYEDTSFRTGEVDVFRLSAFFDVCTKHELGLLGWW